MGRNCVRILGLALLRFGCTAGVERLAAFGAADAGAAAVTDAEEEEDEAAAADAVFAF